ncbi:hypothetical protein [Serratia sarumanii]|uniref:hypothetical protein n=1 Tax=Serratia sarumanii TaxID=3020826 RepID=UPI003F7DA5C1
MTQTLTTEAMQEIYEAAVHVEAVGDDQDAGFELLCKLEDVGGTGATLRKLIDMVRAANREAQPVAVTDEMALAFHRALNDGGIGESDLEEIKVGLRGALCNVTAPPAPAVPDECAIFNAAIEECRKSDSIDEHAWNHGVLVVMAKFDACRAAMLDGSGPLWSGFDPAKNFYDAIPDGWKLVPAELTAEMQAAWDGAPSSSDDDTVNMMNAYRAMIAAAPEGGNDA